MGFNSVYRCLKELFPQVDARLLRAVAIEHPTDADVAAEIILTEVIPSISLKLLPVTPPVDEDVTSEMILTEVIPSISQKLPPVTPPVHMAMSPRVLINLEDENEEQVNWLGNHRFVRGADGASSSHARPGKINKIPESFIPLDDESDDECEDEGNTLWRRRLVEDADLVSSSSSLSIPVETTGAADSSSRPDLNVASNESINTSDTNDDSLTFLGINEVYKQNIQNAEDNFIGGISNKICLEISNGFTQQTNEVEGSESQNDCLVDGPTPSANDRLQVESNTSPYIVVGETGDVEDEIGGIKALGQYDQAHLIGMLEETIDEAKTNKKTLFASMESLINLMKEVELQEKAAEQANLEAASGGSAIVVRADEYKAMLVHAKEANDMHAGEIYGEKAILATELKELQSRLSSLSDEKNKSLAILEEMRQVLESRLAAAENLRKAFEHEKLEKEESARKALLEQEAMMEKVVQESVRLRQEAEDNSELREFLMDRGRLVDMLQGEISVICQDVRLLKEKFDSNLPLSKSFTATQTSCVLASSGSSHKTWASNVGGSDF